MDKLPMTKDQLQRMLVAELNTFPYCGDVTQVIVVPLDDLTKSATWTVSCFRHGTSDGETCDRALQHIVPRFQRVYDMVRVH
jgi:hypothetical protein